MTTGHHPILGFRDAIQSPSTSSCNAPGTNVPVKRSKVVKQRVFLCAAGGGRREEKHRCPVSERPIKQHTGPGGRKLLLTGRHQEKRTFQSTHIQHCTHTHSTVDKILQVSGTAPRERVDLWRPWGGGRGVKHTANFT